MIFKKPSPFQKVFFLDKVCITYPEIKSYSKFEQLQLIRTIKVWVEDLLCYFLLTYYNMVAPMVMSKVITQSSRAPS